MSDSAFSSILKRIKGGEAFDDAELLPFLTLESKRERYRVNLGLAEAFWARHDRGADDAGRSLKRARDCAERAFLLSRYSPEALPQVLRADAASGDARAAGEALKRVGLEYAARGDFASALAAFDRWSYAYAEFTQIDLHDTFDADVIECVERMAALHRFDPKPRALDGRPVRIAYLTHGLTEVNSVLVKIDQMFARHHDRARFEPAYFSVESESAVASSADARAGLEEFRRAGCAVTVAPDREPLLERLLALGASIRDFEPDILVTGAGLASFRNFFVASLRPAPVTVSLHQGPSPQFTWHDFDHAVSWFRTNIPDCPADCSYVPLEFELPARGEVEPAPRAELDVPEDAVLMVSGGRWPKFQNRDYWRALVKLLEEHPRLYWLIIGPEERQISFLADVLTPAARAKIRFRGWRRDYAGLVAAADIFVDSYPIGGGAFLMEGLALGLPAVSFSHDYVAAFSNNDCSGGDEILGACETLLARGDFDGMKRSIAALVADPARRKTLGAEWGGRVRRERGEPARMVRRCEEIYERVLRRVKEGEAETVEGGAGAAARGGAGLEELRLRLVERERALNAREAELKRREALLDASLPLRLERALRWRWRVLTGRRHLGYPE
ncbi:MAG TPA: glycosyltransferase [Pyrinomonadaceae bacterium]|jgi:glycosyltransferase involved in cell wall biosynthesis